MQNPQVETSIPLPEDTFETVLPASSSCDGPSLESGSSQGVALASLPAGTVLTMHTRHSRYRVEVLDGFNRRVRITGGSVFPAGMEVRVVGATSGSNGLRTGWIEEGLRLELLTAGGRVMTSRVESVTVEDAAAQTRSA